MHLRKKRNDESSSASPDSLHRTLQKGGTSQCAMSDTLCEDVRALSARVGLYTGGSFTARAVGRRTSTRQSVAQSGRGEKNKSKVESRNRSGADASERICITAGYASLRTGVPGRPAGSLGGSATDHSSALPTETNARTQMKSQAEPTRDETRMAWRYIRRRAFIKSY